MYEFDKCGGFLHMIMRESPPSLKVVSQERLEISQRHGDDLGPPAVLT